jgi:uncharacterized membrane protein
MAPFWYVDYSNNSIWCACVRLCMHISWLFACPISWWWFVLSLVGYPFVCAVLCCAVLCCAAELNMHDTTRHLRPDHCAYETPFTPASMHFYELTHAV